MTVTDEEMARAANLIMHSEGGLSAVDDQQEHILELPIAGLMSTSNAEQMAADYASIDSFVKSLGSTLRAPYMTLSFMALLVIPKIKMSDKGLFDAEAFTFYTRGES